MNVVPLRRSFTSIIAVLPPDGRIVSGILRMLPSHYKQGEEPSSKPVQGTLVGAAALARAAQIGQNGTARVEGDAMPEFFTVLPPEDALRRLRGHLQIPLPAEEVPLAEALGRVLAEPLRAPEPLPAFPRSTVDGYAVRAADTFGATEGLPAYLRVIGEVPMGRPPAFRVGPGEAAWISTGGMLPEGADAVVMVERTQRLDEETLEVFRPVAPGENVIAVGEDVAAGAVAF
ncbi:MAG: hypothetical protein C4314_04105, partial [Thermoflexus sp.]